MKVITNLPKALYLTPKRHHSLFNLSKPEPIEHFMRKKVPFA